MNTFCLILNSSGNVFLNFATDLCVGTWLSHVVSIILRSISSVFQGLLSKENFVLCQDPFLPL